MRWNHKIGTLTVLLALGITMVGCGTPGSTAGSAAASATSTTSSEVQKTEVQPMQGVLLSDPLSDGTYHISFESDKVWVGERKNTINDAVVYDYDRYTAPEIEALSEGDTIVTHLNGTEETTALTVESIERENNYVTINGGIEAGGVELTLDHDVYRTVTFDDYPVYYEMGEVTLPLAGGVTLSDSSADPQASAVETDGADAVAEAVNAEPDGWTPNNTLVFTEDGTISSIVRIWVP